jgi:DNA-binding NarL/FixJ family response regulator
MANVRIMLVDDHEVVRTGLKTYLDTQDGMEVVAEAEDGEEAIKIAQTIHPEVIVMDISMNGMDGLEATRRLSAICPESKILTLTIHEDKQFFFEMLAAGAVGYLTKQVAADELVTAIRAVADGYVYLQPALAVWLLQEYKRLLNVVSAQPSITHPSIPPNKGLSVLSKREIQVLELVADGKTNSDVSELLGISPKTVARHRERIMSKLNVHSTTELVKFAFRTGLISLENL